MTPQAFLLIGIAALELCLAGVFASQYNWSMFGAWSFLGFAMLCFAVNA